MTKELRKYVKEKIKILSELQIELSEEQKEHFKTLKNEIQIDNYAHDLIFKGNATPWERSFDNNPNRYSAPKSSGIPRYL